MGAVQHIGANVLTKPHAQGQLLGGGPSHDWLTDEAARPPLLSGGSTTGMGASQTLAGPPSSPEAGTGRQRLGKALGTVGAVSSEEPSACPPGPVNGWVCSFLPLCPWTCPPVSQALRYPGARPSTALWAAPAESAWERASDHGSPTQKPGVTLLCLPTTYNVKLDDALCHLASTSDTQGLPKELNDPA